MVFQLDIGTGKVYNYFWGGLREIAPKKITPPPPPQFHFYFLEGYLPPPSLL